VARYQMDRWEALEVESTRDSGSEMYFFVYVGICDLQEIKKYELLQTNAGKQARKIKMIINNLDQYVYILNKHK